MMDDDKLKVLKTEVTSILTSSGSPLTVRQFVKEYKDVIGRSFPWAHYGFKTPTECLKSMPDVLNFKKNEIGEVLVPAQNNSSHITKLVQEQKKNTKRGSIRRPRPFQLPRDDLKNDIKPLTQIEVQHPLAYRGWENQNRQPVQSLMSLPSYPQQNFSFSTQEYSHMSHNLWNIDQMPIVLNTYSTLKTEFTTRTKLPLTPKKAPISEVQELKQLTMANGYLDDADNSYNKGSETDKILAIGEEKSREESFPDNYAIESHSFEEAKQLEAPPKTINKNQTFDDFDVEEEDDCPIGEKMKENFRKILRKHKSGLLVSKLASTYSKMFNVGLNCQDYGFPTIKDLVMSCHDVFKVQQKKHSKDWLLFDVNNETDDSTRWIPRQVLENMQELSLAHPDGVISDEILTLYKDMFKVELDIKKLGFESLTSFLVNCQSIECCTNDDKYVVFPMKWGKKANEEFEESSTDPFLSVDTYSIFSKKRFQDDVCGYEFQYEKCPMPTESTFLKVVIADCISPDLLYLQTLDNAASLNSLMYELNTFYDEEEEHYTVDEDMIHPGLACCVKFNNKQWHRGLINKVSEESQSVKVVYVDYGTYSEVSFKDLRTLHKKFSEPAIHSFRSKLYNVKPINNESWTEQCLEFFYDSIFNDIFVAEVVKVINEVAYVILVDTKDSEDRVINFMLVENGFASYINEKSSEPNDYCNFENQVPNNISEKESSPVLEKAEAIYPDYFLQLLPYWLQNVKSWADINHIFEKASHVFFNESSDDNLSELCGFLSSTKCAQNEVLELFMKRPRLVCDAWNRTFYSLINDFEKKFLENIQAELMKFYSQNEKATNHINHTFSDSAMNSNSKVNFEKPQISSNHSNIPMSPRLSDKSDSYHSMDRCHSPYQRSVSERDDYYSKNSNNSSVKSGSSPLEINKEKKDPKVIAANLINAVVHLIRYNSEIYIIMDEFLSLFAKGVPSLLVKHRLYQNQINVVPFIVTPDNKKLYSELRKNRIDFKNGTVSLVPLSMSSKILLAVEPRNKSVVEVLNDLIDECYSSQEFWSI